MDAKPCASTSGSSTYDRESTKPPPRAAPAANDELRKTLMLQTGGGKVKVHVLGVEKAARVYKNPKYETLKAVIVVETPADIVRLLDLGLGIGTSPIDLGGVVGSHLRLVVLGDPGGRRRIGQQPHAHQRHDGGDQG